MRARTKKKGEGKRRRRRRTRPAQLELVPRGRGGYRPGAGRPKSGRTRVEHRARARLASRHPVHVTMRVRPDVPPLRRGRQRRVLAHALWLVRARWRQRFRVVHFSIQNNHVHLIVEAADAAALARGMQGLAVRIAKRLNHAIGRKGTVWADRYHARALKTPTETRNAMVYVLHNGRHHPMDESGAFVVPSDLDPCSSAPWFGGWKERGVPRAPPDEEPPVESPRTWLLREGWRRAGAISVHDSPAPERKYRSAVDRFASRGSAVRAT